MPSNHALLSPSSASRWLNCLPSARLEERAPDHESESARVGTIAHMKAEQKLKNYLEGNPQKKVKCLDGEMDECTTNYRNYVIEVLNEEKKKSKYAKLFIEVQLDLSNWAPGSFGTSDAVVVGDDTVHVIDFKYGRSPRGKVDAYLNKQMMIYAIGVIDELECLYDFKNVKLHIFQPRLDHISEWELPLSQLKDWAENVLKPKAKMAYEGEGNQKVGSWCHFCKVKQCCKARSEKALEVAERDKRLDSLLMTDDQVSEILPQLDDVIAWAKDVQTFALEQALSGTKYQGYKLVEGISRRKVVDPEGVKKTLLEKGFKEDDFLDIKLKGLTALEKLVGKKEFNTDCCSFIEKPPGKPTLVKESDKRPEYNSVEADFKDL